MITLPSLTARTAALRKENALSGAFPIATGYPPPLNGLTILYIQIYCFQDGILAAKRANTLAGTRPSRDGQRDLRQADTSELEKEIDHAQRAAPRQLYGLTKEEIDIVEGK